MFWKKKRESKASAPEPGALAWGRHRMPESEATGHYLAVGASGSGKSSLLQLLTQTAFSKIGVAPDMRAIVYDAKQDVLPLLAAICPAAKVVTSHPFDARGAAWDISRDVTDPAIALEIAVTIMPAVHESQPFFSDAARHLAYGVMQSFILTGAPWSLATFLRVMKTPQRIRRVLNRHAETRDIVKQYFYDPRLASNIMSTIATKLLPLEPIAAAWEGATQKFSLEEWRDGNGILVLGNYETGRTAIDAINRCIFKRSSDLVLNQSNSFTRRTWFLWDEVSEAGKLDGLVPLMKKGRSKGACCVLAFQSVQGLRDPSLYGAQFTDEILGQVANRFFGRIECVATAEWASSLFGDQEFEEESVTESTGAGGGGHSVNRHRSTRRLVMPAEFMNIEPCNRQNGLSGYYIVRSYGAYFDHISGDELFDKELLQPRKDVPEFVPRPASAKLLRPWTPVEQATYCAPERRRPKSPPELDQDSPSSQRPPQNLDDLDDHFQ